MDSSNAEMLRKSMAKKKKTPGFKSTDAKVDPSFLRDMGYGNKSKPKKKKNASQGG